MSLPTNRIRNFYVYAKGYLGSLPNESLSDLVDKLIVMANNADKPYETDKAICEDIPTYD